MKRFFILLLSAIMLFSFPLCASAESLLSESEEKILSDMGIDTDELNSLSEFSAENIFLEVLNFIKEKGKTPLKIFLLLSLSFVIFGFTSVFCEKETSNINGVCLAVISAEALYPVCSLIKVTAEALKSGSIFLISLLPALAATVSASGKPLSAARSSAMLLGAAEVTRYTAAYTVVPLLSAFMALSLGASVYPELKNSGFCPSVKNAAVKILGFVSALFLGVLSATEKFAAAKDGVGARAAKLVLSGVPVAGPALGEMFSQVLSSVGLLKSTLAAYAEIALIVMLLPVVIEILCFRLCLLGARTVSSLFGGFAEDILSAFDSVLAILLSLLLFFAGIFIISLGAVVSV